MSTVTAGHPHTPHRDSPQPDSLAVLVVDDHPAVRAGLERLLEEQPDLTVVGAVDSVSAGLALAKRRPVDVVVADYELGRRSGLWLSRRLKRLVPAPGVVIYSAFCDGLLAAACVVAQADGLVSKGGVGNELCDVLRAVARGETRLPRVPPTLAEVLRRQLDAEDQAIFGLLLAGLDRQAIAQTLRVSAIEIDTRMAHMLRRLEGRAAEPTTVRRGGLAYPRPVPSRRRGDSV